MVSQAPRAVPRLSPLPRCPAPAQPFPGTEGSSGRERCQAGRASHPDPPCPAPGPGGPCWEVRPPWAVVPPACCPLGCCCDPLGFIFLIKGKLSVS